jgi:triacylglycerol esterase/lipase EstA (alpha/beta hydrolase family)
VAWTVAQLALLPTAFGKERFVLVNAAGSAETLAPTRSAGTDHQTGSRHVPILLVHGLACNRSMFTLLRRGLRRRGFDCVATMDYSLLTTDVRSAARLLGERVEQVCADTGVERINLVGHSLGGLITRYYVQCLGGDQRVDTLFTLGTPHKGTAVARLLWWHPLVRQLRPDSELITELANPAATCRTRFIAFYSDVDQMVVPSEFARVDHPDLTARNVLVRGVYHNSLPLSGQVVEEIYTELTMAAPSVRQLATGTKK